MMQLPVDKIYYINLKKSVTRNNAAKEHFKQIGLVDKNGFPPRRFEALGAGDADFPIKGNFSQGEIGCFASHRALWKMLAEKQGESWLILEDDARFDSKTHYEHFNRFDRKWIVLKKEVIHP
jgi:GR25 family glycosyltransferase involved in LPS biosynthesis